METDGILSSILIIGCNRGLGLELVRFLLGLKKPPQYLYATCRDLETSSALKAYNVFWNQRKTKVRILQMEVNNDHDISNAVATVESELDGIGLSLLINNAETHIRKDLDTVNRDDMIRTFETNTIAPIMIAKAFRSILSSFVLLGAKDSTRHAALVNISSVLGSISANGEGGMYPYRASKTALNMATRCLSSDFKDNGIIVISLHPRNIPSKSERPLPYKLTVANIIKFLLTLEMAHTGGFFSFDGMTVKY